MVAIGIDLHAMIEGCQQRPSPGTALKLGFDPFNAVSVFANLSSTSASASTAGTSASASIAGTSASASILVSITSTSIPPAATTTTSSSANERAISSHEALIGGIVGGTTGVLLVVIVVGLIRISRRRKAEAFTQQLNVERIYYTDQRGYLDQGMQEMSGEQRHEVDGQCASYETKSELQANSSTVELGSHTREGSVRGE